ncbi:hypothetical protein K501DRAFT_329328 [Backusella circina FSU 941]|nr:hypothetical protein K501DRAFT_329328 [Backusella circina FSU 941]
MTSAARRSLELTQLETRYKSTFHLIKEIEHETVIRLGIQPSDPDFPFALEMLQIQLNVPKTYPDAGCTLQVINPGLPKLYATHVEKGYQKMGPTTLVRQMNWLDKHMASLLQEMEDLVKRRHQQYEALKSEYTIDVIKANNKGETGTLTMTKLNQTQQDILGESELHVKYHMPVLYPQEPCTIEIANDAFDQEKATCIIKAFNRQHKNRDLIEDLKWLNHNLDQVIQQEQLKSPTDNNDCIQQQQEEEEINEKQTVDPINTSSDLNNHATTTTTYIRLVRPKLEKISLFHCILLDLMVKCNQCNDILDVKLLADHPEQKQLECLTCHQQLKAKFLSDVVHQGTVSLGTLKLTGCMAYDMLSSQFKATCGQCMADLNDLIVIAPHDLPYITHCQSCQSKMTAKLSDFQFMQMNGHDEKLFLDEPMTMMMLLDRKKNEEEVDDGGQESVMVQSEKPCTYCDHMMSKEGEGVKKLDPMHRQNQHKRKGLKKSALKKHEKKK